jgi:hypothetical protein
MSLNRLSLRRNDIFSFGAYQGCPTRGVAQPDPSNRIDYEVLIRFSSSYKLPIRVNTSLQSFYPFEKNLNSCLTLDGRQNDLNADQKIG